MSSDPFESPKILVSGAREDLAEVKALAGEFHSGLKVETYYQRDGEKDEMRVLLRAPKPSDRLRRKATSLLNDLRHALDQASYAASMEVGPKHPSRIYFPFAADPDDFKSLFVSAQRGKGRCCGVSAELIPFFEALQPWWRESSKPIRECTGDDLLRALGYLTNQNKHRAMLDTGIAADGLHVKSIEMGSLVYPFRWDPKRRELEIARTRTPDQFKIEATVPLTLSFGNVRGLGGLPLETVLLDLIGVTERIVLGLEAKAVEILAARAAGGPTP